MLVIQTWNNHPDDNVGQVKVEKSLCTEVILKEFAGFWHSLTMRTQEVHKVPCYAQLEGPLYLQVKGKEVNKWTWQGLGLIHSALCPTHL